MTKLITVLLSLIVFVSSSYASSNGGAPEISVAENAKLNIGRQVQYLVDPSGKLGLEEVRKANAAWHQSTSDTPSFGYTEDAHWFRYTLDYRGISPLSLYSSIEYSLLDHIEYYQIENDQVVKTIITGDSYPFSKRVVDHRNFLFPITLKPNHPVTIYLRVQTSGSTQIPLAVTDAKRYMLDDSDEVITKALYYGLILALILYNLFIYIAIKERPYIFYVCFMLSILIFTASSHGMFYQYLCSEYPRLQEIIVLLSGPSVLFFACLFTSQFLKLSRIAPALNNLLLGLAFVIAIDMIAVFFLPYHWSIRASAYLVIPSCLIIMFAGPYAWRHGQISASYFTVAWLCLLTGMLVGASSKLGFISVNVFTEYAFNWGSAIEALLLSFALADKFNQERMARFQAQKEQLKEIEHRKEAESKLYHQATHQSINGFPNMVILQQVMNRLLSQDKQNDKGFTLVLLNLSRLHEINKTLGHGNADLVLSLFSKRLRKLSFDNTPYLTLEENEDDCFYFCHVGGVLFAQILDISSPSDALSEANKIRNQLSSPVDFNGMRLDLGLTIGLATYPDHGSDTATLIRHSRVAVDVATKSNPPIGIYASDINPYSARRLALMGELKQAIDDNALELYFQPLIDCKTRQLIGAESLLRWKHPEMGFIPPDEFIPVAEKTGIIDSLTNWVLEQAFRTIRQWHQYNQALTISVNISAVNLHNKDFTNKLTGLLEKYELSSSSIVLEVTETAVMKNPEGALSMLNQLAELGYKIGIDDFGTGHSSLSYIRKLPVYEVKIDKSFVINMADNSDDAIITKTALNLSHDLGYKVVAEGVENEATVSALQDMGCDFIQGFHIARPMPLSEFSDWIAKES
jgi:diguanylate cyclase (GGDEF)-like protein